MQISFNKRSHVQGVIFIRCSHLIGALHPLLIGKCLHALGDHLRHEGDVLVPELHPQVVVLVQQHLLLGHVARGVALVPAHVFLFIKAMWIYILHPVTHRPMYRK